MHKENYQSDTVIVEVSPNNRQQNFHLNALPQLAHIRYYSERISTIFSAEPLARVVIEIQVNDPDGPGDIDSAQVIIDDFNFMAQLQAVLPAGSFQLTINKEDLGQNNIHDLVERPLRLNLADKTGAVNRVGPYYISRFIENTPVTLSPANQEIATQPLFLQWQKVELPYSFMFEISIYKRESGLSRLLFNQSGINSKATYYNYNTLLDNGIYYWTITIVDAQNNSSESKEAVFQIR